MAMLDVTKLSISFGGLRAVDELTMQIEEGGLVGLIGPNGAGKTTVFNMLTGVYQPTEGGIRLDGKNLIGKKPADICKMGVARTFQNIRLFPLLQNREVRLQLLQKFIFIHFPAPLKIYRHVSEMVTFPLPAGFAPYPPIRQHRPAERLKKVSVNYYIMYTTMYCQVLRKAKYLSFS